MQHEPIKEAALFRVLSDLIGDLADLFQKELRLAKAEITANLTAQLQAGIWMAAAAAAALVALLLVVQAAVFALMAWGLAGHWACLLVAAVLLAAGFFAYRKGKSDAARGIAPERTIRQIKEDIKVTKEQLV